MVVSGIGVFLVEFTMDLPKSAMIGAMFPSTVKACIVRGFMSGRDAAMLALVLPMIALMAAGLVIIVGKRSAGRSEDHQGSGCQ